MPTPPSNLDAAPAVPTSTDPESTFDSMFEAFLSWLKNTFSTWVNATAAGVYANAQEATQAATTATAQSAAAVAVVNAPKWVAKTYSEGEAAWSPSNGRTYRRIAAGASATDPAADLANWWDAATLSGRPIVNVGATTVNATPGVHYVLLSASSVLRLPTTGLFTGAVVEVTDLSLSNAAQVDPQTNKIRAASGVLYIRGKYWKHEFTWSTDAAIGWV
jgi:hypothetical protein